MRLYILRHAQSLHNEWFIRRLYTPSLWTTYDSKIVDASLSNSGTIQAKNLENQFKSIPFDLVICSPLTRALQTMNYSLGQRNIKTIITPLIRERCDRLADTGKPLSELKKKYENYEFLHFMSENWWETKKIQENDEEVKENNETVKQRANEFKNFLKTREEKNVLVITHGNFIRILLNKFIMSRNCQLISTTLDKIS